MKVEVSNGELIDKITILRIKRERIADAQKNANVVRELEELEAAAAEMQPPAPEPLVAELTRINEELWEIEDRIRDKERQREFDEEFIQLARSVYHTNDKRAALKKDVNTATGSGLVEEKSYQSYA